MKEKNLSLFKIRTDLIDDIIINTNTIVKKSTYKQKKIIVNNVEVAKEQEKLISKKSGFYTTIYFDDITDTTNFLEVETVLLKELKKMFNKELITKEKKCLVIGLGNDKSTPDSLGVKVSENIIVTKHIYDMFNSLEEGYSVCSSFAPGVMGTTGIETSDILKGIISLSKPDYLIVVDALASDAIDRVCKTIQITNAGINPGSGIGNKRKEISKEVLGIPVIAIGVPMVVDAVTIVSDTIDLMMNHFSYSINNKNNKINKFIPSSQRNYLKYKNPILKDQEKTFFFGQVGMLSNYEKRSLVFDVLTPVGYNLMVTPKEVDFLIDKLTILISNALNKTIHNSKLKSDII